MRSYTCKQCEKKHASAKSVIHCCVVIKKKGYTGGIYLSALDLDGLDPGDIVVLPTVFYDKYSNPDWIYKIQEGTKWNPGSNWVSQCDKYSFFYVVVERKGKGKYDILTDGIHDENTRITIDLAKARNNIMKVVSSIPEIRNQAQQILREYTDYLSW